MSLFYVDGDHSRIAVDVYNHETNDTLLGIRSYPLILPGKEVSMLRQFQPPRNGEQSKQHTPLELFYP